MSNDYEVSSSPGKIAVGSEGLGTVTPEMVEERARELAKIDGRLEVNEADRLLAKDELVSGGHSALAAPEEVEPELAGLTSWDEAPETTGTRAAVSRPSDETTVAEQLVQEGVEEADHDQRVTAADANPPEELA